MADHEVTAPDQHKPISTNAWRALWIAAIAVLLLLLLGNHTGRVEDLWLIGTAATIAIGLVADAIMRKRNWKPRR